MARQKTQIAVVEPTQPDDAAVSRDLAALDEVTALTTKQEAMLADLSQELAVSLPKKYDEDVYVDLAKQALIAHSISGWQLGVILIAIHANTSSRDEFIALAQERISLSRSQAYMYMATVKRFATEDGLKLVQKLRTHGITSFSKIAQLQQLTNTEVEELLEGDGALGLTADDVATMSTVQLRKALREARANEAAKDALIAEKDAKINKLTTAKKRKPVDDPDDAMIRAFETDAVDATGEAAKLISTDFAALVAALDEQEWTASDRKAIASLEDRVRLIKTQQLAKVANALRDAALSVGIPPADIGIADEPVMPADFT